MKTVGTKAEVYRGDAHHTPGGLKKDDLIKNKRGTVVSKAQHANGMRMWKKNQDAMVGSLVRSTHYKPVRSPRRSPRKSPRKSPRRSPRKSPRRSPRRSPRYSLYRK